MYLLHERSADCSAADGVGETPDDVIGHDNGNQLVVGRRHAGYSLLPVSIPDKAGLNKRREKKSKIIPLSLPPQTYLMEDI